MRGANALICSKSSTKRVKAAFSSTLLGRCNVTRTYFFSDIEKREASSVNFARAFGKYFTTESIMVLPSPVTVRATEPPFGLMNTEEVMCSPSVPASQVCVVPTTS